MSSINICVFTIQPALEGEAATKYCMQKSSGLTIPISEFYIDLSTAKLCYGPTSWVKQNSRTHRPNSAIPL
jgi:hypothetical protein